MRLTHVAQCRTGIVSSFVLLFSHRRRL